MKKHCITMADLETIHREMHHVYGCVDDVNSTYAHIINLLIAGYFDEGIDLFLRKIDTVPLLNEKLNIHILRFYSEIKIKQHEYANVINHLSKIVYAYESAELYNNYAIALVRMGQVDQAVEALKRAALISPEPAIKRNLEKILTAMGGV